MPILMCFLAGADGAIRPAVRKYADSDVLPGWCRWRYWTCRAKVCRFWGASELVQMVLFDLPCESMPILGCFRAGADGAI
jgi:hypothetical protein